MIRPLFSQINYLRIAANAIILLTVTHRRTPYCLRLTTYALHHAAHKTHGWASGSVDHSITQFHEWSGKGIVPKLSTIAWSLILKMILLNLRDDYRPSLYALAHWGIWTCVVISKSRMGADCMRVSFCQVRKSV
jgi:hypothetical protein